ncbi:MAG: hypothetical protein ACOX6E_03575 [Syntrophomonadaceae bacterium]|jgi:hypothetical protein
MLQASQANRVELEYEEYTDIQKLSDKRINKVRNRNIYNKKTLIKVGFGIFIYSILVVYLCIKVSTMGYQVIGLEKEIEKLYAANHKLEFKIAEQVSLDKIELIATRELGMHKLDASKAIPVIAYQAESKTTSIHKMDNNTFAENSNLGQKPLQKLYSNLMLLAEKN